MRPDWAINAPRAPPIVSIAGVIMVSLMDYAVFVSPLTA
jgi:hypothetical protein